MKIELSQYCKTCNQPNDERNLIKTDTKNRKICKECGAYVLKVKSKRAPLTFSEAEEATFTPPEITNPRATTCTRVSKPKWKWKIYTEQEAAMLGANLIDWLQEQVQATSIKDWLIGVKLSYLKLQRMAQENQELAEALDLANMIIADRFKEQWEASENMDINKYAPKFYDLHCPRVAAQQDKKLKLEVSAGQGIPYHDPTYPNLITKNET